MHLTTQFSICDHNKLLAIYCTRALHALLETLLCTFMNSQALHHVCL